MPKHNHNGHHHSGPIHHGGGGHHHHRRVVICNGTNVEVTFPMLYIVKEGCEVVRTVEVVKDRVLVDYDADGDIIAIEIL